MLHLVDELTGLDYALEIGQEYSVGRNNDGSNQIVVPYSESGDKTTRILHRYPHVKMIGRLMRRISKNHLTIRALDENVVWIDDESSNGTFDARGARVKGGYFEMGERLYWGNDKDHPKAPGYPMRLLDEAHLEWFRNAHEEFLLSFNEVHSGNV